ncbi:MAG: riboflavin synthase [Phycisphaerales bacterium]
MFTGLVQAIGQIAEAQPTPAGLRLLIDPGAWPHRSAVGDSIAVSGVCLTVAAIEPSGAGRWAFDAVPETLAKTTLGRLKPGDRVNLEHAVTASTLMGGHFVQGHVDGVGTVASVQKGADWRLTVTPPAEVLPFLAPKGSITIDGVSLTIAALTRDSLTVALIPTTLDVTTLGTFKPGDGVNIEADMLAKTVVNYLRHFTPVPLPHEKGWG